MSEVEKMYWNALNGIKEVIESIEKDAISGYNHSASFVKNSEFDSIQNKANGCLNEIRRMKDAIRGYNERNNKIV